MPMSKAAKIASISCGSLIVAIGIICLVLGLMGYFNFEEPCVSIKSFTIDNLELGSGGGGILGALTGGLVPSQVEIDITLILEANNTNVFDLDYEQGDEGIIIIPASETALSEDMEIGTWTVPKGTLKKNAVNEIPVSMSAVVDMTGSGAVIAASFLTGGPIFFQITGGIDGDGWVPGLSGQNTFVCMAGLDNVLAIGQGANVQCEHSTSVAGQNIQGDFEQQESIFAEAETVDPSCIV